MQGPACSGNCGIYKTKHINKLSIQEAEFNNWLINEIQGRTGKEGEANSGLLYSSRQMKPFSVSLNNPRSVDLTKWHI